MFVDNVGVLAQLTKGSSSAPDLAPVVGIVHLLLARYAIRVWWEYVDSAANCSDGLSRLFARDPFAIAQNWVTLRSPLPEWGRGWLAPRATLERICAPSGSC